MQQEPVIANDNFAKFYGLLQGVIDNLSNSWESLVQRDIMPDIDLLQGIPTRITKVLDDYIYQQTYDEKNPGKMKIYKTKKLVYEEYSLCKPEWLQEYPTEGGVIDVYRTDRHSNNDRKVIILTGIANLSDIAPRAMYITIWRGEVKIIDKFDLSSLAYQKEIKFPIAALFKRGDDMRITLTVPPLKHALAHDRLQLKGVVTEALGITVTH
jgi:hypothetical protein